MTISAHLRAALTRPVDRVLWAFDWRAWAVVVVVLAIVERLTCS